MLRSILVVVLLSLISSGVDLGFQLKKFQQNRSVPRLSKGDQEMSQEKVYQIDVDRCTSKLANSEFSSLRLMYLFSQSIFMTLLDL